jgi:hypothetical protein
MQSVENKQSMSEDLKVYTGSNKEIKYDIKDIKVATRMGLIGKIEPYLLGDDFDNYEERMEQFFIVNKVEDAAKVPLFITLMGADAYKILKSIILPKTPNSCSYTEIIKALKQQFTPKINKRTERLKFSKAIQEPGESVSAFIIKLKMLAQTCEFKQFLNDALTDRFIVGLNDDKIQQKLLEDEGIEFEGCCSAALNMEMSAKETRLINFKTVNYVGENKNYTSNHRGSSQSDRDNNYVRESNYGNNKHRGRQGQSNVSNREYRRRSSSNASSRSDNSNSSNGSIRYGHNSNEKFSNKCERCGRFNHKSSTCRAIHWKCFNCNRYGHISTVCKASSNRVNTINGVNIINEAAELKVEIEGHSVTMEIDTGACSSVICLDKYKKYFEKIQLCKVENSFSTVTGQNIEVIGKINVDVMCLGGRYNLELVVIKANKPFRPLFGRTWMDVFMPKWRSILCNHEPTIKLLVTGNVTLLEEIKVKFPSIVNEQWENSVIKNFIGEIILMEDVTPIFQRAYSVPFKLRDKVESELDRLCKMGILESVKFSKWASPIVVVPKADGDIRICIDCKMTINKVSKSEHYPLPRIDDIFANLSNCNYFCVLDLTGAYQQVLVSEKSREYITINTHKRLFRYTRLPFGLKSAPSLFQSIMDQILRNLSKVACYLDDIIVGGVNFEECKNNLFDCLKRLNEFNVKINLKKCKLIQPKVDYLGHTISKDGIRPNQEKVKAVCSAPAPQNKQQLQAYLGLLNYYGKFIPNLSMELKDLYRLLRNDVKFVWSKECEESFKKSKELLLENNLLELYDPKKPIILATDASPYGIGAILSHLIDGVEKSVLFASSTLSTSHHLWSKKIS